MKPLLCNTQVVTNILSGLQTQDRRPIKNMPKKWHKGYGAFKNNPNGSEEFIIYGDCGTKVKYAPHQVGDILYVREAFVYAQTTGYDARDDGGLIWYKATDEGMIDVDSPDEGQKAGWKPSIHMPKWAARIFLEVTGARVERVQDISEADAIAEGMKGAITSDTLKYSKRYNFEILWKKLYPGSWERNDFVWVTDFKRTERPK